ncbi:MAG: RnfABCDGE type electron transport complex subunit D [Deltaproteobacteria bacterium]|nr:RnfABCDGE type electron transport complex subunit D [Deltaproteobacteria bacterium]
MTEASPQFLLSPGPHLRSGLTTKQIMWWVNVSLAPIFLWAISIYGVRVVWVLVSGVLGALFAEGFVNKCRHQKQTLGDGSAVLTGILLVGTLSPGIPIWMPFTGSFVAIVFAKMLFGGLGYNIFNPALIGRAFLMATFPLAMTTTWLKARPGLFFPPDAVTQATPLNILKMEGLTSAVKTLGLGSKFYGELFLGLRAGSIGEVSVLLILLGAGLLLWKGIIKLPIPLSILAGLGLIAIFSKVPLFHLLTGGVWFGAFFMATDYVTAPMSPKAQIIFGLCVGLITGVIRLWGGYPEGICYAILIMNAVTPALNRWFRPSRPKWEGTPS